MNMTLSDSLENSAEALKFKDVEFIQLRYTDVLGRFLAKYVVSDTGDPAERVQNGIALDGSSVRGFSKINESDLLLIPDRSTLRLMPLPVYKVATAIADVYEGFGNGRMVKDPRYVPQVLEEGLSGQGLMCQTGPEVECFVFDDMLIGRMEDLKSNHRKRLESTLFAENTAMTHLHSKTPYWIYDLKLPTS
jgi:glutamine synthetase